MGYCDKHNKETPCTECNRIRIEKIEAEVKKQKDMGHCGSVDGGFDFVCQMHKYHVGECKIFSTQDGKVIAAWWKDDSDE